MTESARLAASAEDVLYEFAMAKERPDAELLETFVRRYPELADELTSFAVAFVLDAATDEEVPAELDAESRNAVARAMSHFHNRLYEVKSGSATRTPDSLATPARVAEPSATARPLPPRKPQREPRNPFVGRERAELRKLADHLHANTLFIMMLRDRAIVLETMTEGFLRTVAEGLKESLDDLRDHFGGSSLVHASPMEFKSKTKPQAAPKQSFEEAVRNSNLTDEQQTWLLKL